MSHNKINQFMNTYKLSKRFFDHVFETIDSKPFDIALYFYILDLANRLGWKELIDLPTRLTMAGSRIGAYPTYKRSLVNLSNWGFIDWVYKATNDTLASNVIKLNCFDKNDEADTKALAKAVMMQYQSRDEADASTINYKPLNHKPKTNKQMEIFFEKEDFEKYQNLKADNQKLIKNNLEIILKTNFELLSTHELSNVDFKFKINRQNDKNFEAIEKEVSISMQEYFGLSELNNFRLFAKLNQFIKHLEKNSQIDFFQRNFYYYQKYKEMTGQTQHSFQRFIGDSDKNYEDGIWLSENFKHKLKQFESNQKNTRNERFRDLDIEQGKKDVIRRLRNG